MMQQQSTDQSAVQVADIAIAVTALVGAARVAKDIKATSVLSLLDADFPLDCVPDFGGADHKVIFFDDLEDPARAAAPTDSDVAAIIGFFRDLAPGSIVLVHCVAGRCRSTAAALIGAVIRLGNPSPDSLAAARGFLKAAAPLAIPNTLLGTLADRQLNAGGALAALADDIGRVRTIDLLAELDA